MADARIDIRTAGATDGDVITSLLEDAFDTPDEARLVARLQQDGDAAISLVAAAGSAIGGFCLLSVMRAPAGCLGLAPLAVAPEFRRQGLGAKLVAEALRLAREAGWQAVFVLGEPGWYGALGFSRENAARFETIYPKEYFLIAELEPGAAATFSPATRYAAAFDAL